MREIRRFTIYWISLLVLLAVAAGLAIAAAPPTVRQEFILTEVEQGWLRQHPMVRVRISPNYPPFEFFENGSFQGIEVDYLAIVGKQLGIEFRPVLAEVAWAEVLERFRANDGVDLILGITRTAEREKWAAFTDDYVSFPQVIFSRKDAPFISGVNDLAAMTTAIERGFVMQDWLKRDVRGIRFLEVTNSEEALDAVATGRAEVYVGNLAIGSYFIEKRGLVNLKVAAPTPYGVDAMGMAARKDWPELAALINRVLRSMSDEEHRAIRQRWLSLRYEHGLEVKDVILWSAVVVVAAMLWIIPLRFLVKRRTAELQQEVLRRTESEQHFRQLVESAPEAIFVQSGGRFVYLNPPMLKLLGAEYSEDLIGVDFMRHVAPEFHEVVGDRMRFQKETGRPALPMEQEYVRVDGSRVAVETAAVAIRYHGSDAHLVFVRDITERKRAEEDVRRSEEKLKLILENAPFGVFVLGFDGKGLYVNRSAEAISGYSSEEMLRKHFVEFVHPDDRDQLLRRRARRLAGEPVESNYTFRLVDKSGAIHWMENRVIVLPWEGGPGTLNYLWDVTERIRTDEVLKASEYKYRRLYESMMDGYVYVSMSGQIIEYNDTYRLMLGYSDDELKALKFQDITPEKWHPIENKIVEEQIIPRGYSDVYSKEYQRKDGAIFPVELRAFLIKGESGKSEGMWAIVRDITERKRAEEALKNRTLGLMTLLEVSRSLAVTLDQKVVLQATTDGVVRLFGLNTAAVYLLHGDTLRLGTTTPPLPENFPEALRAAPLSDHPHIRRAVTTGSPVLVPDIREAELTQAEQAVAEQRGLRTVLYMPLIAGEKTVGVLIVGSIEQPAEISDANIDLCRTLSNLSAIAVENARLYEALGASEEQYRDLFESAIDAICVVDNKQNFLDVNRRAGELFGYSREELLSMNVRDLLPPDQVPLSEREFAKLAAVGSYERFTGKIRKKDGTTIDVEVSSSAIVEGDEVVGSRDIIRDVTERKRSEESLRASERLTRSIIESIPVGMHMYRLEAADRLVFTGANPAADRILGMDNRVFFGKTIEEAFPPLKNTEIPQRYREVVKTGMTWQTESIEYQDNAIKGAFEVHAFRTGPDTMVAAFEDITTRKRAEEEREKLVTDIQAALTDVSRSQKEWQDTFDNITDMISIHDADYTVIRANKAFSQNLGLKPDEVIGSKCYDLMHQGARSPITGCPHQHTMDSGIQASEEVYDDLTGRTFKVTTYPYVSPDGAVIGSIHIARDITDEKEREMKMIMTERLASLGQMASGIAHEINNPLASVMICSEMLLMKVANDHYDHSQFEKYLRTIDEEIQRCRDITTNMLSFARQTSTEKQAIDVQELLDKALALVGFQGRLKNVEVKKHYGSKVLVQGSEGELRQVFLALVVNALDAMQDKGVLTLETGQDEGVYRVRISDTGRGIPEEIRQKIFQPFFTTKSESGGTGLGLSIAHRIISNHQGSLDVNSEPGSGTTFTISLPC